MALQFFTDQWVRRLNALTRRLDDTIDGVHPSAWRELTAKDTAAWKLLAKQHPDE